MNYRSGFRRLYLVVLTPCWILFCAWGGVRYSFDQPHEFVSLIAAVVAAFAIIPPLIGYPVFFNLLPWIVAGFKSKPKA